MPEQEDRRGGYTLFCDDIREETNNKTSYIGVYNGELNFYMPFPATLPKFCIAAVYYQPSTDEACPVTIKAIIQPEEGEEEVLVEGTLPEDAFRAVPPGDPLFTNPRITANANIIVSPFTIKQSCVLKVRAYYKDEEIKLGAIVIRSKPIPELQQVPTA